MRRLALATGMLGLALSTAGAAEKPRLHPLEKYCAWYEQTGMQSGQIQECSREYGWERFEKRSLVTQVGPRLAVAG